MTQTWKKTAAFIMALMLVAAPLTQAGSKGGLFGGTSITAYADETESLLTTITATGKEQASYTTENIATVSFSYEAGGSSEYLANWGWWGYGWTATVTPAEGYTITKCVFYDDANRKATDSEAPFVVETKGQEDKTPQVNGTPILAYTSKGITKIEVYGYATPTTLTSENVSIADFTYDGTEKTPVLKYGETVLVKGEDYELVTTDGDTASATDAGEYTIHIKGKGDYAGENVALTWKINKADLSLTAASGLSYNSEAQNLISGDVPAGTKFSLTAPQAGLDYEAESKKIYGWASDLYEKSDSTSSSDESRYYYSAYSALDSYNYALRCIHDENEENAADEMSDAVYYADNMAQIGALHEITPSADVKEAIDYINTYIKDKTLADVKARFATVEPEWKDTATATNAGKYTVYYKGSGNYNDTVKSLTASIAKATASPEAVTGLTAAYGKTLADVTLPDGWAWDDALTTSVGNVGNNTFSATFTPADTKNYDPLTTDLTVNVTAIPATPSDVDALNATYGQTLADVALPTAEGGTWAWKDAATTPVGNAGEQTFTAVFTPSSPNYSAVEKSVKVNVAKADPAVTAAPEAITGLTCTGEPQTLVTEGAATGGTMQYGILVAPTVYTSDGKAITVDVAKLKDGDVLTVTQESTSKIKFTGGTVKFRDDKGVLHPENIDSVSYNYWSSIQPYHFLDLNYSSGGGSMVDNVVYNSMIVTSKDGNTVTIEPYKYNDGEKTTAWNAAVPAAADAGTYQVAYRVVGDENYSSLNPAETVKVTIGKGTPTVTAPQANVLTYTGKAQELVTAGSITGGTMQYSLDGENYAAEIPKGTKADTYTVWYRIVGDNNYNDVAANSVTVTIGRKAADPAAVSALHATYGQTLADVALPSAEDGTWAWKDAATTSVGNAGEQTFTAVFTPENANYTAVERDITVNVAKADPTPKAVTGLTAAYGKTLADVTLPTGWAWNDDTLSVGNVGNKIFSATFTPTDTANYNNYTTDLTVNVLAVDKTSLNETISSAQAYLDTIKEDPDYAAPVMALNSVITAAKVVYANDNVTAEDVAQVITDLNNAVTEAKAEVVDIDDTLAAQAVADMINALPALEDIVSADKEAVDAARQAYTKLSSKQSEKVEKAAVDKLAAAEKAVADHMAADDVEAKINAIGKVELTDAVMAKINIARTAYDALSEDQQVLVRNAVAIGYAEDLYKALEGKKTAEEDKAAAEAAKTQAEADAAKAVAAAQAAQKTAEEKQAAAEAAQKEAEEKRAAAEEAQVKNEADAAAKVAAAEAAQKEAEEAQKAAEAAQKEAEEAQKAAEAAQKEAEEKQAAAEAAQKEAEAAVTEAEQKAAEEKAAADQSSADKVIEKINAIGEAKETDYEKAIVAARSAYDTLTDDQKELVTNVATLVKAESYYNDLPQTGMSGFHRVFAAVAGLMGIAGVGLVKKSRKEDEE